MAFCAAQAVQQGQPAVQPLPDGQRTHLQAQHVRVTVHHQAAQPVGISVQHTVRISGFIQAQNFPAQLHGAFQRSIQVTFGKTSFPWYTMRRGVRLDSFQNPAPNSSPFLS